MKRIPLIVCAAGLVLAGVWGPAFPLAAQTPAGHTMHPDAQWFPDAALGVDVVQVN